MERVGSRKSSTTAIAYLVFLLLLLGSRKGDSISKARMGGSLQRTCESPSQEYAGRCNSDHNCEMVCRNEGFTGGWCRAPPRRCFCTKPCP